MMKIRIPVEPGNAAIKSGALPQILQETMERVQPEAAYFTAENGWRTAFVFFDLKEPSDIPSIAEPLFQGMNAEIHWSPCMNQEDLEKGLAQL